MTLSKAEEKRLQDAAQKAEEVLRKEQEREERRAAWFDRTDAQIAAMGSEAFERLLKPKIAQAKKDYPSYTPAALRSIAEHAVRRDLEPDDEVKGASS